MYSNDMSQKYHDNGQIYDMHMYITDPKHDTTDLTYDTTDLTHNNADLTHNNADLTHNNADLTHNNADLTHNNADLTQDLTHDHNDLHTYDTNNPTHENYYPDYIFEIDLREDDDNTQHQTFNDNDQVPLQKSRKGLVDDNGEPRANDILDLLYNKFGGKTYRRMSRYLLGWFGGPEKLVRQSGRLVPQHQGFEDLALQHNDDYHSHHRQLLQR
ncbi:hypothetical protein Pmani_038813 [Petrolisthes manimaculis]|uniref:Uncharacterized protein n=1 Tax=Petrolisthes manimaculis TaxID=1843537 RepID=A0AAE1NFE7_9EUCA|nr:hypothetical protein Pmani_038813 [Petrolisthes manimaculis]